MQPHPIERPDVNEASLPRGVLPARLNDLYWGGKRIRDSDPTPIHSETLQQAAGVAESHWQGFSDWPTPAGHLVQHALGWQQMQPGHRQAAPHLQAAPHGQGQAACFAAAHWPTPAGHLVQHALGWQQMQPGHLQAAPHLHAVPQGHWHAALSAAAHWHGASHVQAGWHGQDFGASASAAALNIDATRIKCVNIDTSP